MKAKVIALVVSVFVFSCAADTEEISIDLEIENDGDHFAIHFGGVCSTNYLMGRGNAVSATLPMSSASMPKSINAKQPSARPGICATCSTTIAWATTGAPCLPLQRRRGDLANAVALR